MSYTKLLLLFIIVCTVTFSQAQDNITNNDSIKKVLSSTRLHHFNYYPWYSFNRNVRFNQQAFGSDRYHIGKMSLNSNKTYQPFLSVDLQPLITRDNFSLFNRREFNYRYDITNPFHATNPADALFDGSTDYLLWLLIDK